MLLIIKDIKGDKIEFTKKMGSNENHHLDYDIVFIANHGFSLIPTHLYGKLYELGYREHFGTGMMMPADMVKVLNFKHPYIEGKFIKKQYKDDKEKELYGLNSVTYKATEGLKFSFGVELETSDGVIPERILREMSVNSVRDGSLKDSNGIVWGSEIVTDVLKGDSGFRHLQHITSEISKRCKINNLCAVHIHVGQGSMNPIFSKEHIVYLYQLCLIIQRELKLTLPKSRRNNEYCRDIDNLGIILPVANKMTKEEYNYNITENYDRIISYLANHNGYDPKKHTKYNDHPKGFKCGYDHSVPRYCWANFVPTVFDTRKNGIKTFEIRNHGASLNYRKVKKWALLCMALVHFADSFKDRIVESLTINDILRAVYPRSHKDLIEYFHKRKEKFSRDNNGVSEEEEYMVQAEEKSKTLREIIYD